MNEGMNEIKWWIKINERKNEWMNNKQKIFEYMNEWKMKEKAFEWMKGEKDHEEMESNKSK